MKNDELGARMKSYYEDRTRLFIPRRTYTIIRLDGKSFHTYTKGFERPYDLGLMRVMDNTAIALCKHVQNVKMAYVQSDEISLLLTDFDTIQTDAWFGGNIQKMASVSASIATAHFNNGMYLDEDIMSNMDKVAYFDSRVFSIPDREEVKNYLVWRQQDATRNSIQMGAQSVYSQKELNKKNTSELQEMMFQKGINWDKYPVGFKRGRVILKESESLVTVMPNPKSTYVAKDLENGRVVSAKDITEPQQITRITWGSFEPPVFTRDRNFLQTRIPLMSSNLFINEKQDETNQIES